MSATPNHGRRQEYTEVRGQTVPHGVNPAEVQAAAEEGFREVSGRQTAVSEKAVQEALENQIRLYEISKDPALNELARRLRNGNPSPGSGG